MIKIFINADGSIAKREPAEHKEVYADFDVSDSIVIDEITWEITLYPNSKQWQDRLAYLIANPVIDDPDDFQVHSECLQRVSEQEYLSQ